MKSQLLTQDLRALERQIEKGPTASQVERAHALLQQAIRVLDPAGSEAAEEARTIAVALPVERRERYFPARSDPRREVSQEELATADARFAAARERGQEARRAAYALLGPLWTPSAVAEHLRVSRVTVNNWREKGKLLALRFDDRGYRFPAFQFATSPDEGEDGLVEGCAEVLRALPPSSNWRKGIFFLEPSSALGGEAPIKVLRREGRRGVARVLAWATAYGEMGT